MSACFQGKVWKFGDNINGDDGILDFSAVRDHSKPFDEVSMAEMCFRQINPDFATQVRPGDIVGGGINFAKPGHDQVVIAIQQCGIQAILCESCEARFVRKGINIGLPIIICPGISQFVDQDHILEVDLASGRLRNLATDAIMSTAPYPQHMLAILEHGGIIAYLADRIGAMPAAATGD